MAKLDPYRAKRDFQKTREPDGSAGVEAGGHAFVIQKHDASRLHYDLRLELDGVMKSWAVAKGPSLVAGDKRLAVHVEDHPIAYNTFEGTIPKGQYGGGTVMVWDRGTWAPEHDPQKGYAKGHIDFSLAGEKLGGAWHLVRMRKRPGEKQEPWLLIKADDAFARAPDAPDILDERPLSVASGRDLDAIAAAGDAVWDTTTGLAAEGRAGKPAPRRKAAPRKADLPAPHAEVLAEGQPRSTHDHGASFEAPRSLPSGRPKPGPVGGAPQDEEGGKAQKGSRKRGGPTSPMPAAIEPCLATLVSHVPEGPGWLHEIKWDGYRLVAFKQGAAVRIATRRGLDWTRRFPGIAAAVAGLPVETAILDGEAVVEDSRGLSSFSALQAALSDQRDGVAADAILYAFDLLYLEGEDLRAQPLEARKARLAGLVPAGRTDALRLSEHVEAEGGVMVRSACSLGLEGVISKRRDKPYRSGRNDDWRKTKCTERQEFVIVGYVPSSAATKAVGSLVLGYNEGGALRYAGRSGTGFTAEAARDVFRRLKDGAVKTPPVADRLTSEERRGVAWVTPALVAEIEFRGWTGEGRLRHAAFKGLREDKRPDEVFREVAQDEAVAETSAAAEPAKPARKQKAVPPAPPSVKKPSQPGLVAGIKLTHPDRVLWEETGVTKQGLAEFDEAIARWLLPHVVQRPLSLVRCPAGAAGHCFFQKHSWAGLSDRIRRETVREETGEEEEILYVEEIGGVVALVQAGVIEIHPWGATIADVDAPDRIVMDLDPGEGVTWPDVIAAARDLRTRLAADGLTSFVKTTGGKGLHVVVPLEAGTSDWVRVKAFAKGLAESLERDDPSRYVAKSTKAARTGRIYVDYLRNGRGATAVAAYSTRARPGAPVSVPLAWDELSPALGPDHFTVLNLGQRLARLAVDPWADLAGTRQALPGAKAAPKARRPRR